MGDSEIFLEDQVGYEDSFMKKFGDQDMKDSGYVSPSPAPIRLESVPYYDLPRISRDSNIHPRSVPFPSLVGNRKNEKKAKWTKQLQNKKKKP